MRDYQYFEKATDEQLQRWMQERINEADMLQRTVDQIRAAVKIHQDEIEKRALRIEFAKLLAEVES